MPQRRIHTYIPDDFIDLGEAGEHPICFKAEIQWAGFESRTIVVIFDATVQLSFKDSSRIQKLDLLPRLREYPDTMRKWEDEILKDWEQQREERGA